MVENRRYPWNKLSTDDFEELSLDYAKIEYPEYKWKRTKKGTSRGQGDGNRDIEAKNNNILPPEKYWIEAKTKSKDFDRSITKGQGDPTLVSAILDKHVKFLMFITCGSISMNYMKRAQSIMFQHGCEKVLFVEGFELEEWLDINSSITLKYFKKIDTSLVKRKSLELRYINIYSKYDFSQGILSPIKDLQEGDTYILYFRFFLRKEKKIQIQFEPDEFCKIITKEEEYNKIFYSGSHNIQIRWIARKPGEYNKVTIIIKYGNNKYKKKLEPFTITTPINFTIQYESQTRIIEKLKNIFKLYFGQKEKLLSIIYGAGGVGKTYVIEQFEKELPEHIHFKRYKFSDDIYGNSKILCDFILRINYSTYLDSSKDIFREILINNVTSYTHFISKEIVQKLFIGSDDGVEGRQIISELQLYWQEHKLITAEGIGDYKVFVLEDVHYLTIETALFLIKVANDLVKSRINCTIIFSGRPNEFLSSKLKNKLDEFCTYKPKINSLTSFDISNTIYNIIGKEIDLSEKIETGLKISILHFEVFLSHLKTNKKKINNEIELYQFINETYSDFPKEILDEQLKEYFTEYSRHRNITNCLDLIMLIEEGVDYSFINNFISESKIKNLIDRKIINLKNQLVFPYHDLILEKYKKYRGNKLGTSITNILNNLYKKTPKDDKLLSLLIISSQSNCNIYFETVKKRIYTLLMEKKYTIINFILKNVFRALQNNELLTLPVKEELWIRFYYAMSSDHIGRNDLALAEYNNVIRLGKTSTLQLYEKAIIYEARTEIFNYEYWNLKNIPHLIKKISSFIENIHNIMECYPEIIQELTFKKAVLNAYNRAMASNFLLDNYQDSEHYFLIGKSMCLKMSMKKDLGYLYMDYAKATYQISKQRSLKFLKRAKAIFEELNTEKRRLCVCNTDIDFLEIVINKKSSLSSLQNSVQQLKSNGYYSEYKKGQLKEIACLLKKQNFSYAYEKISSLLKNYSFTMKSRSSGILANIMAAYYFATKDYNKARKYCVEHEKCFSELGDSYISICKNNIKIIKTKTFNNISFLKHGNTFKLDVRIW